MIVHTLCFRQSTLWVQNSQNQEKQLKIVVSAEIAQNHNWHLFFEKGVFGMGEKRRFY